MLLSMTDTDLQRRKFSNGCVNLRSLVSVYLFHTDSKTCLYSGGTVLEYQIVAYVYPIIDDKTFLRGTRRHSWLAIELSAQPDFLNNSTIFKLLFFSTALLGLKLITLDKRLKKPARGSKCATQQKRRSRTPREHQD